MIKELTDDSSRESDGFSEKLSDLGLKIHFATWNRICYKPLMRVNPTACPPIQISKSEVP